MNAKDIIETINKYKTTFETYKKKYLEDGKIDALEQAQLDKLEKAIKDAENILRSLKKDKESPKEISTEVDYNNDTVLSWEGKVEKWLNENKAKVKDHFFGLAIGIPGISTFNKTQNKYQEIVDEIKSTDDSLFNVAPFEIESYIENWTKKNAISTKTSQDFIMEQVMSDSEQMKMVEDWLKKNNLTLKLNIVAFEPEKDANKILAYLNKVATEIKDQISELKTFSIQKIVDFISDWLSENDLLVKSKIQSPTVKTASEFEKLFAKIKNLGKFDWKFADGKLELKIDGPSASFAYKPYEDTKVELKADTSGAELKAETKLDKVKIDAKVSSDYEGKVKVAAGVKIEELFDFMDIKGSASLSVKGDSKSWSVELTLASSNGSQAHLSRKAAEKLHESIHNATDAVSELYKILETENISIENFSEIKEKAKKQWEKVSAAISELDNVAKTPAPKSEIFISFGLKGEEKGVSGNLALTLSF